LYLEQTENRLTYKKYYTYNSYCSKRA